MTVGRDKYFMMGDHRSISSDSRDFGRCLGDWFMGARRLSIGRWTRLVS